MFANENEFRKAVEGTDIDDAPRLKHQEELRKQVLMAFDEAGTGDTLPREIAWPTRLRRKLMYNRPVRIGAASLAAACVLIVVLWTLGPGTGVALAKVQELIEEARTVYFEMTTYRDGESQGTGKMMFMQPGKMRAEWPGMIAIFDWNQGKILSLLTEGKIAHATVVTDIENPYHRNWLADLKAIVGNGAAEEMGRRELLGHKAKGWKIAEDDETCTVWADATSGELLQVERARGSSRMVMNKFVLNPDLDESLFDMTPPQDYKLITQLEMTEADPSEADIIILLRVWVSGNGGKFPDRLLDSSKFSKAAAKADRRDLGIDSQEKAQEFQRAIGQAFYLLHSWKLEWGYVGKGVEVGQADQPVFWHHPEDSDTYRVIFGDFSVAEVAPETFKEVISRKSATGDQ